MCIHVIGRIYEEEKGFGDNIFSIRQYQGSKIMFFLLWLLCPCCLFDPISLEISFWTFTSAWLNWVVKPRF